MSQGGEGAVARAALPRVLHDAATAVLLVDLPTQQVVFANDEALAMAPGLSLPVATDAWADAAGLRASAGAAMSSTSDPLSRVAAGEPVHGEGITAQREVGDVPAREPLWVVGLPLDGPPPLAGRAVVVFLRVEAAQQLLTADGLDLATLRDRAVVATELSFTISDPHQPDNPLVWVNPSFARVTGYDDDFSIGRNCRFLQGPATDPAAVQSIRDALAEDRSLIVTLLNYRRDGTAFWNELAISPVRDAHGRVTHHVGVQTDVTLRVEAEQARAAALAAERRARERLALLSEATVTLAATLDADESVARLGQLVVPRLADWCAVDLLDDSGAVRRAILTHGDPGRAADVELLQRRRVRARTEESPVLAVLESGTPQLLRDVDAAMLASTTADPEVVAAYTRMGTRSAIVVPLRSRRQTLGTLTLVVGDSGRDYDDEDVTTAADLARRAGLALDNARLYDQEHHVAEALQRSLLPTIRPIPGVEVATRYLPGSSTASVGGDWYDVLALPDGAIGVAVGDAMGHDIAAAAAMGQLRSVLRSYAWEGSAPGVVLARLDRLVQGLGMASLATCVYARIERAGSDAVTLRWANAGHLPPLALVPGEAPRFLRDAVSPLIGAPRDPADEQPDAEVTLPVGTTLVLCTDGLVERRDADLDVGLDRLAAVAAEAGPDASPEQLADLLLARLGGEGLADGLDDDVALLIVKVLAPAETEG